MSPYALKPDVSQAAKAIPKDVQDKARALSGRDPWAFFREAFLAWFVIIVAIACSEFLGRPLITILCVTLIATRQAVLGLLVHEQAHYLLFRSRVGEAFVNAFAAYPLLISVDGYANVHLAHHRFYFSEKDPDAVRKSGEEWEVPKSKGDLLRLFAKDLMGLSLIRTLKGKSHKNNLVGARPTKTACILKIPFYLAVIMILIATGTWKLALIYWVLPLATVLQALVRWGALCEHFYNTQNPAVEESTPIIIPALWERIFLPNLNFTYGHVYHHYFPTIPQSQLPAVHRIFEQHGLVDHRRVFRGYRSYMSFITRKPVHQNKGVNAMNAASVRPNERRSEPIFANAAWHALVTRIEINRCLGLSGRLYKDSEEFLESTDVHADERLELVRQMNRAHEWMGYHKRFIAQIESLIAAMPESVARRPIRIIDLGMGGGGLLLAVHRWAKTRGIQVQLCGLDISEDFARGTLDMLRREGADVTVYYADASDLSGLEDNSFDIVVASLMTHHIRSVAAVAAFLKEVYRVCRHGYVIQDLDRTLSGILRMPLGIFVGESLTLISDGIKSIRRAYSVREINWLLGYLSDRNLVSGMSCRRSDGIYWLIQGQKYM